MSTAVVFKPGKYEFQSADSGRRYVLTILNSEGDESSFRCSCRGFQYHGHCKHVEEAILFSEIPDAQLNSAAHNTTTTKENTMSKTVTTRKVVRRTKHAEPVAKPARAPRRRHNFPLDVLVNVKVAGERAMRKSVVLTAHPTDPTLLRVKTGTRGRPSHLAITDIERVRAL